MLAFNVHTGLKYGQEVVGQIVDETKCLMLQLGCPKGILSQGDINLLDFPMQIMYMLHTKQVNNRTSERQ